MTNSQIAGRIRMIDLSIAKLSTYDTPAAAREIERKRAERARLEAKLGGLR